MGHKVRLLGVFLCAASLVTAAEALSSTSTPAPSPLGSWPNGLAGAKSILSEDPLSLFHASLELTAAKVSSSLNPGPSRQLAAGPDTYLHLTLPALSETQLFEVPSGLTLRAGDFFFLDGRILVEASLLAETPGRPEGALEVIQEKLGRPVFDVSIPGSGQRMVGWQLSRGYLITSFDGQPFFRISAFRDDPLDLLAGSQIVLFEGLHDYAQRLAEGAPPREVARELMRVVLWVAAARTSLTPLR